MPFCCYHTTVQHVLHLIQQFHVEFPSLRSNGHFSRWSWVSRYQNVSILDFIGSKDDGAGAIAYVVWCPCSDFMDMFWRLTNCRIITIRCAKLQSNHYHQLHWMPVKHRITFKVATLMHQALHRHCPAYLADLVAFSSTDSHRQLRSTTTKAAAIQRTRTQFGRWAFSVCGPDVWNSLTPSVRTVDSNSSFRHALKTHLFQLAFNN